MIKLFLTPQTRNTVRGFTLIELLTVIAIIGILASILIPVVSRVRASARTAKCASHLRSTATAMVSHINEHDGVLRTMKSGSGTTGYMWTRVLRLEGYFEGTKAGSSRAAEEILCPEGEYRENPAHEWDAFGLNLFDPASTTGRDPTGGTSLYVRNFNDADINPSRYILMADSIRQDGRQIFRLSENKSNPDGAIALRHNERANVAFFDGHVELLGADRLRGFEPEMISGRDGDGNTIEFPDPYR